ncbi:hypothetical protein CEXT_431511 [Caerostris extrusa]|uniref:Uncharacterized protein n=1 Tax=Caerostris extrusa TaxID=172846 RepID=A0AAV4QIK0_CAEEX|nr:hypothetical protein CEXT_431511 [Caerostris extrusa]
MFVVVVVNTRDFLRSTFNAVGYGWIGKRIFVHEVALDASLMERLAKDCKNDKETKLELLPSKAIKNYTEMEEKN